jgi:hypothetical protein
MSLPLLALGLRRVGRHLPGDLADPRFGFKPAFKSGMPPPRPAATMSGEPHASYRLLRTLRSTYTPTSTPNPSSAAKLRRVAHALASESQPSCFSPGAAPLP